MAEVQLCAKCGATLYAQWWNEAEGGFQCRRCGTPNPGKAPDRRADRLVIGMAMALFGLWVAGVAMVGAVLALYPAGGPWRVPAIAALAFLLAGFAVLIAIIVVSRRGDRVGTPRDPR